MKTFIGIIGTTGVGKSAVAVELAKMTNSFVISADSMQIYKEMDIGTAKISKEEMQGIRHFMVDIVPPNQSFSAFDYQKISSKIIDDSKTVPIVVGGTGFYFDSLLFPPEFREAEPTRRKQLKKILQVDGIDALQKILKDLDPETFNTIDINNPMRVMRAIEIAENGEKLACGKGKVVPKYNCLLYVLQRDRKQIYNIIGKRVDQMIDKGLVEEVRAIVEKYGICDTPAYAAIGYKEIIEYLKGRCSLNEATAKIKLNTRHYAKRQITYYKKMETRKYIDVENLTSVQVAAMIYDDSKSEVM